ncbi:aconitate hydratase (bifunctional aconitase) [Kyrpidia spormannii]|uniref:Aconitate hydratase n=2 Tax=Kyrpidia spormannii TaxID=2055160 RepID=A0A6F9EE15_9BACL|nr:aconitate hydratase (bifunctional aconitase) [Kyrpidia spormannii]
MMASQDVFQTRRTLEAGGKSYVYYSLPALDKQGVGPISRLPYSIRVLLEAALRQVDGKGVTEEHVKKLANWQESHRHPVEIPFKPARIVLQDFTGVPAVVDLAAMRRTVKEMGGDPSKINPLVPVDLVIDHSVQVDLYGTPEALERNMELEFQRNEERYRFLRWAQGAFENFRVVPPSTGIVHQVNLEYLASVVGQREEGDETVLFPDSLVGTDSHTTMINGLGVLGWGVGGIEAEAGMLGQPLYFLIPEVIGFRLTGRLPEGSTATDLALTVTNLLRKKGVVGKFVEFFGPGLSSITVADRATVANMAPEYGATMGYFPVDERTLDYLRLTGRKAEDVALAEAYLKAQGLLHTEEAPEPVFSDIVELDLSTVKPTLAGPKRPQDKVPLPDLKASFEKAVESPVDQGGFGFGKEGLARTSDVKYPDGSRETLRTGAVVIAAITSCTNTSNPSVMIGAGLLAKKAVEKGLTKPRYVKSSLAPGSRVVTAYLKRAGLLPALEQLGFAVVGYGCTTCIGNSGPLDPEVAEAIQEKDMTVAAVLSGNRNFEGRIHPLVRANYLASPPLVVAYALAGTVDIDLSKEPLGTDRDGNPVYLKDIWPSSEEVQAAIQQAVTAELFSEEYAHVLTANQRWNALPTPEGELYHFDADSTYIQEPPFFVNLSREAGHIADIRGARVLALLGDSVTTDHISPAGSIAPNSPAAKYLMEHGVERRDFNSYGSRRGNHEVMMRGTFANIRIRNLLAPGTEGGVTVYLPTGETMPIYDAAMKYQADGTPLVVLAGKEYGTGSSRDWAAKGTMLLGVKAVLAESFERIHRSNLVGMGVLPLQFTKGESWKSLGLTGKERFDIQGLSDDIKPLSTVRVTAVGEDGGRREFEALVRLDSVVEIEYYRNGGILQTVLRQLLNG